MNRNFYIDMDGVLVQYDYGAYKGDNPKWLRKNTHYFRNLPPDRRMLEFVDRLHERCRYNQDKMFILTTLPFKPLIFNEHFHDKMTWIAEWCPYLDVDHILIAVSSKNDAVEYINDHKLTKNDILIDDWKKNLKEWNEKGGTAVKYCNGINSPDSFDGIVLMHTDPVWTMFHKLDIE